MSCANATQMSLREEFLNTIWEDYIFQNLIKSKHVTEIALYELQTEKLLFASEGFQIYDEELLQIIQGMIYPDIVYRNGVTLNGNTYKVRLADGKQGIFANSNRRGCTVCKTLSLLIIGTHDEDIKAVRCNEEVMKLGDFFVRKGL